MNIDTNGFELGDVVRDTITGLEGTVIAIHQWTTGCARVSIQPRVRKDGTVPESQSGDVLTLELVKAGPRHSVDRSKGGPRPDPVSRVADVRR